MPEIKALENHTRILSGNVAFGVDNTDQSKNMAGWHANGIITPATPDTDFAVPISLGYLPTSYQIKNISANANIYTGATPWTEQNIFLRCSVASVTVSLFIY
jgi:PKD repeat protein